MQNAHSNGFDWVRENHTTTSSDGNQNISRFLHSFSKKIFKELSPTQHPPREKPMMVWDGDCSFCKYWILRWKKITGSAVDYHPYHDVAKRYPDIDVKTFRRAVRFIETDGQVFSGAAAAYRSFTYGTSWNRLWSLYRNQKWFRKLSDWSYDRIAKNRPIMFKITILLFGRNPEKPRPYWLIFPVLLSVVMLLIAGPWLFSNNTVRDGVYEDWWPEPIERPSKRRTKIAGNQAATILAQRRSHSHIKLESEKSPVWRPLERQGNKNR